jgi:chromatin segregation and condensation protein Rec8/ScpA/Scc1 (kleisin family)
VPLAFEQPPEPRELGTGLDGVTLNKLVRLVQKRMQLGLPAAPAAGTATRGHTVTVAEKVAHLRRRVSKLTETERIALGAEFEEAAMHSRTELVVLFLAVLEMIRRKYATAEQDELFGEIWIRRG